MNRWSTGDLGSQGSENTVCDSIMVDTCHHPFVQTHTRYNTE